MNKVTDCNITCNTTKDILNRFTMYNFETNLGEVKENGDVNIVASFYSFKNSDDVDVNAIFNVNELSLRIIYTAYKFENKTQYYSEYCVDKIVFSNNEEVLEFFDKLEFDDMIYHGSKFESMYNKSQNWIAIKQQ